MKLTSNSSIVILTGAGISQESGLNTFRDKDGLWAGHKVETVCTPQAFDADPDFVNEFYNKRRREVLSDAVKPNAAHYALARLQTEWSGNVTLITQNVDPLHEAAGSENVIHMHGELLRAWCLACREKFATRESLSLETACPSCNKSGHIRPDIVFFHEMPYHMPHIRDALDDADLFVAIGTSGQVAPASTFVTMARSTGAYAVEINKIHTGNWQYDQGYYGNATEQVPRFVEDVLAYRL